MSSTELLGPASAFLSSFTWAVGTTGYSRLSRDHSPFVVNVTRALIALPLFLALVFITSGGWSGGIGALAAVRAEHWGWFATATIASYALGDALFMMSTRDLGIPGALAIGSAYPIWTAAGGYLLRGEGLSTGQCFGVGATVAGIIVVILSSPRAAPDVPGPRTEPQLGGDPAVRGDALPRGTGRSTSRGLLLALLTSLLWALNGVAISEGGRNLSSNVANVLRMVLAIAMIGGLRLVSRASGRFAFIDRDAPFALPFAAVRRWYWVFAVEAFGGSCFFMYGLSHSPLAIGATLSSLAPAISVPIAWIAGLESFSALRTSGIGLVIVGIALLVGS